MNNYQPRAPHPGRTAVEPCHTTVHATSCNTQLTPGERAVGPVQGDGDAGGPVVDPVTDVEQVAQDGPVLVGVSEVGVEMLGQPRLAVVGQQPQHHLQAAALDPRAGLARRDFLYSYAGCLRSGGEVSRSPLGEMGDELGQDGPDPPCSRPGAG